MKMLFAMFQGGGNIPLIAPILPVLVSRGHDVRVLVGPGIRGNRLPISDGLIRRIEDAGARRITLESPSVHPFDHMPTERGLVGSWLPSKLARAPEWLNLWAPSWAHNMAAEVDRDRPDVVVVDFFLPGAMAAAEKARLPYAVLMHNIPVPTATGQPPRYFGYSPPSSALSRMQQAFWGWAWERVSRRNGLPLVNEARTLLGLGLLHDTKAQLASADRILMLVDEEFDFPARHMPANVRYVGSPIDDRNAVGSWHSPWPHDDTRPLVLVTLSTLSVGQAPLLQRIIDATGGADARVLVTLGPALRREAFTAPDNCVLEAFVPHSTVLPHTSVVISQCGMSTLAKTLANGVPVVCIPLVGDQPDNAARVEASGAGVRISSDASVAEIGLAVDKVLRDPGYKRAAQRLGAAMSRQDAAERAADEIEALAGRA